MHHNCNRELLQIDSLWQCSLPYYGTTVSYHENQADLFEFSDYKGEYNIMVCFLGQRLLYT